MTSRFYANFDMYACTWAQNVQPLHKKWNEKKTYFQKYLLQFKCMKVMKNFHF